MALEQLLELSPHCKGGTRGDVFSSEESGNLFFFFLIIFTDAYVCVEALVLRKNNERS